MNISDFAVNRSRPQFAFLLLLMELLSAKSGTDHIEKRPLSVHICEPMFTADDAALVRHFEISLLENLCGRYNVSHGLPILGNSSSVHVASESSEVPSTLFWMPHCPKELYATVLESNWNSSNLSNIVILGNSFESITSSLMSDAEKLRLGRIFQAHSITRAALLPEYADDPYIFNNTAMHSFHPNAEQHPESSQFWHITEEERNALANAFPAPSVKTS